MTVEFDYTYKPQGPTLDKYIASTVQRTFICGPLGSSKTNASCWKAFRIMCAQAPDAQGLRKTRILAVRNTYPDLLGTTVKDWLEMFGDLGRYVKGSMEPPTHSLKFELEDGTVVDAEMIFLALDREEHVRKLRGLQLTAGWLNEAKELPFGIVEMLDLRVGRFPKEVEPTWYGIFGDSNAPDTDEWYYTMAEEQRAPDRGEGEGGPEGWLFLKQPGGVIRDNVDAPWRENPDAENLINLPRGYYVKGAQGKKEDWIKVNLANEYGFVKDGKPVYPDYRDSVHCRSFELVKAMGLHIGLDFGLTPAALIGQKTTMGQWRIRREYVTEDTGIVRFATGLKLFLDEHFPAWPIVSITGDPAGDQRQPADNEERNLFQILHANDIMAEPAFTNDFTVRAEAFSSPMRRLIDGEPGLLIHPDCKVTRKGCQGGYAFKRLKVAGDERYRDKPDKNRFSHPCEAGQYMVMGGGEGQAVTTRTQPDEAKAVMAFRARQRFN